MPFVMKGIAPEVPLGLGMLGRSIPEGGAVVALRSGPDVLFTYM